LKPDLDFAPIAKRIREGVGLQGFMTHIGAEISELARGTCTLAVDRRPELLQQHGFFHGGVTAFLVDMRPRSLPQRRAANRRSRPNTN
jgi:acyl-coenzyme A thioesterase PaaI-like protein